jgi:hypothetical protein
MKLTVIPSQYWGYEYETSHKHNSWTYGSKDSYLRNTRRHKVSSPVSCCWSSSAQSWPYFCSSRTYTCFEMGPSLPREEGSDYYWSLFFYQGVNPSLSLCKTLKERVNKWEWQTVVSLTNSVSKIWSKLFQRFRLRNVWTDGQTRSILTAFISNILCKQHNTNHINCSCAMQFSSAYVSKLT